MPLHSPYLSFAIECDENELETFDVRPDGPSSTTAFVASEAGKQFRVTYWNNLLDTDLALLLRIDGEVVRRPYLPAGQHASTLGIHKNTTSLLPFKFRELELVDPDMEEAPVVPEMGTIEVQAFRTQVIRTAQNLRVANYGLQGGRVSERSKMAGWHHVSTADEIPTHVPTYDVVTDNIDPVNAPCATFKVFYRPRELLMAQGLIPRHHIAAETNGGSEVNDRKRTREDELPGPSKRHSAPIVKREEIPATARAQRIRDLQAELNSLMTEHSSSSVKRELRSPSPIVVNKVAGEVIDLTLDD